LLAAFLLSALACGSDSEPKEVWNAVARPSNQASPSIPLVLEQLSRHARAGSFEIPSAQPVERIRFSIGVLGAARARGPARFGIRAERDGSSETVFEDTLEPGPPGWHERLLELPENLHSAARFRFESSLEGADPGRQLQAYIGSPLLLARHADPRPNVVFLLLDILAASYLGHYGQGKGISPGIDAFLADSFSFQRAYAQYGATLTSTLSLLTGLHPIHHGIYAGAEAFTAQIDSLVEDLAASGYLTAAITEGGGLASGWGTSVGFDWYDNGPLQLSVNAGFAPLTFREASRWLQENGSDNRFVLMVHTYEVHAPYMPRTAEARGIIERVSPGNTRPLPARWQSVAIHNHNAGRGAISRADLLRMKGHHLATIHELDQLVSAFLQELAGLGLEQDTLVVLLSDHGEQFGEDGKAGHGESLHNRVLHVPLGFRWPGRIEPGESEVPVQLVDVMPSVLELVGQQVPAGLDGRSLAPLMLRRPDGSLPRAAFSELRAPSSECARLDLEPDCELYRYSVQTQRFKLVSSQRPTVEALYDLQADPAELRDVAGEHQDELARHRALLDAHLAGGRADAAVRKQARALDPATRSRLHALGYLE
jgi:arylsulfatase A-like enzyme